MITPYQEYYLQNLNEGGAYGHMLHPYDDYDLTFKSIEDMIIKILSNKINIISEKMDGMNIMLTWKEGVIKYARNKSHLKDRGQNSLTSEKLLEMFKDKPHVVESLKFAIEELEKTFSTLGKNKLEKIFLEGKNFMSLEIIHSSTQNVIPYGQEILEFQELREYDIDGNLVNIDREQIDFLRDQINQINGRISDKLKIKTNYKIELPDPNSFVVLKDKILKDLHFLMKENDIKPENTIKDFLVKKIKSYIKGHTPKEDLSMLTDLLLDLVSSRLVDEDSVRMKAIYDKVEKGDISRFKRLWLDSQDKWLNSIKKTILPIQNIFMELSINYLKSLRGLLIANPEQGARNIVLMIDRLQEEIVTMNDEKKKERMSNIIDKINEWGTNNIIPSEGLVFSYEGKTYKLTGLFAPINQLQGLIKFDKKNG